MHIAFCRRVRVPDGTIDQGLYKTLIFAHVSLCNKKKKRLPKAEIAGSCACYLYLNKSSGTHAMLFLPCHAVINPIVLKLTRLNSDVKSG